MSTDPSARLHLDLEPVQVGLILGALAIAAASLWGRRAELACREVNGLMRDIREQVAEQSNPTQENQMASPFNEGLAAFHAAQRRDSNPYPLVSSEHHQWDRGWLNGFDPEEDAQREREAHEAYLDAVKGPIRDDD